MSSCSFACENLPVLTTVLENRSVKLMSMEKVSVISQWTKATAPWWNGWQSGTNPSPADCYHFRGLISATSEDPSSSTLSTHAPITNATTAKPRKYLSST